MFSTYFIPSSLSANQNLLPLLPGLWLNAEKGKRFALPHLGPFYPPSPDWKPALTSLNSSATQPNKDERFLGRGNI